MVLWVTAEITAVAVVAAICFGSYLYCAAVVTEAPAFATFCHCYLSSAAVVAAAATKILSVAATNKALRGLFPKPTGLLGNEDEKLSLVGQFF